MTDELTPHQALIKRLGSHQKAADAITAARPNEKPVTKSHVQYWYDSGFIPSKYHSAFLFAGKKLKPKVQANDFFTTPPC